MGVSLSDANVHVQQLKRPKVYWQVKWLYTNTKFTNHDVIDNDSYESYVRRPSSSSAIVQCSRL